MLIGVALKRVDARPEVDPLTGAAHDDERSAGASPADRAALEWALRCAEAWSGARVRAVTAGGPEAEAVLREALAAGAHEAVRVDLDAAAPSETVAAAVADALAECDVVWCGDYSLDRGSGSVPAYLAARLGAVQALGLLGVELGEPGVVRVVRRLDGGRRERLHVVGGAGGCAVLSVEGSTARLRRASLAAVLTTRGADVHVVPGPATVDHAARVTRPFRPRARVLPPPHGSTLERVLALTDAHATPTEGAAAEALDPPEAAERILAALRAWGYLPEA